MKTKIKYFDELSAKRIKQRKAKGYYWNDITRYSDYFIHEDHFVLEIGCGTGELLNGIKAKRKVGVDFSPGMIQEAKKQFPHLDLRVMQAEELEFTEKFDVIVLSNLIGYLDDIQDVFLQLHNVCHENTKIIITYYNFMWEPILKFGELIGYKTNTPAQNWLSLEEIKNLLELSGFKVYRNSRRMILPVYIPLVSELFNNILAKLPFIRLFSINNFTFAKPIDRSEGTLQVKDYSVSVIIPARNESGNIENAIRRIPNMGSHTEIIFVEGNSKDDTWERIVKVQKKYSEAKDIKITQCNTPGKSFAVRKGFEMASGDILMILDADLTVQPEDLPKFYDIIASGKADFVNGSRLVYQMDKNAMSTINLLGNKFFSIAFTWLLDQRFKDTLCGTKVIFKKDYKRLADNRKFFGEFDPFGDFDLLFGAHKLNLCIVELPIHYKERTYGSTNISRFKHGLILLKMCFFAARKIKFR
ncbi:MAG: glycosyltransferase [Bacteroidetes bacterium]|nr:glycosyltransferase [Bacteroidota bacterium]